ncbi:unnamed protein product [Anisakis simplex]|uniref:Collagen alpha-1(I) chain-like n=1 Tax=Anisakis simplex TaxID=6269 RepID=A0A0M3KFC8_ANISI|nr:unnamed protein product [Anisakis simplex]
MGPRGPPGEMGAEGEPGKPGVQHEIIKQHQHLIKAASERSTTSKDLKP